MEVFFHAREFSAASQGTYFPPDASKFYRDRYQNLRSINILLEKVKENELEEDASRFVGKALFCLYT